ncbi:MAG: glycosyl hydrolase [Bacteroidota bacterium]|nr:glycosyl hydrolase [Bacteroidota bacterium]
MKRRFVIIFLLLLATQLVAQESLNHLKDHFQDPPLDCWPHTRWWWPGNAVSKEEITWELEQMRQQGIRGVEQITMAPFYEKGNIPYLSDEFFDMVKHTVKEAKRLGMEVSFNFGGPFWIYGGTWLAEEDRSKDMIPTYVDLKGPQLFYGTLPDELIKTDRSWELYAPELSGEERLLAVVAGRIENDTIDESSLIILTSKVKKRNLEWEVPEGNWRLMAFWLAKNEAYNAVDHFNKASMMRYCNYIGEKFKEAVGDEFGETVESFFGDSFELPYLASGIKWSNGLMEEFEQRKGYDITPYLPGIWWQLGDISPGIRYDVNDFLNEIGREAFFETFLGWCKENGVKGRIQPYGFETDILQAAGMTHIPEMEITPGEKDQHPWFDTRIGPKKYVASGAHIYGRDIISAEAFTFLHWERYRATLEEIKIAADGFLRSGATKFYNHGYSFLPERDLAPSRRMPWAPQINPSNVWWEYYPKLTQYIARSSFLLRQGSFAPDIAIYSPLANQWSKNTLDARRWTRSFDWGELGNLLISNGYDFDLLNDDALQNIASFEKGLIRIREMEYKILLIPNIEYMPLKTLKAIDDYVRGGGVVIALDRLPEYSTGLRGPERNDEEVQKIIRFMFQDLNGRDTRAASHGNGKVHFLHKVIHREIWWDQWSASLDPFLKTIKQYIQPDFGIDFAHEGIRKNSGLTFLHRKLKEADIYFVSNIQDISSKIPLTFRVKNRTVWKWDPYTGETSQLFYYKENENGIEMPLKLNPWESTILIFEKGDDVMHVEETNLSEILTVSENSIQVVATENGVFSTKIVKNNVVTEKSNRVYDLPPPLHIGGSWHLTLESKHFEGVEKELSILKSWTDDPVTRNFSGKGTYEIAFEIPGNYLRENLSLHLDPGRVGNIADIWINGREAGIVWMTGQTLDITELVHEGENSMRIYVTNTNINRVSAFKEPLPVPSDLQEKYGKRKNGESTRLPREFGFEPLPASGLLGPVKIIPRKKIKIDLN